MRKTKRGGKKMRLGGGGRFKALTSNIESREGYGEDRAKAIAASIGRKKYGAKKFGRMSQAGKRRKHAR